jgi:hypothetical protein
MAIALPMIYAVFPWSPFNRYDNDNKDVCLCETIFSCGCSFISAFRIYSFRNARKDSHKKCLGTKLKFWEFCKSFCSEKILIFWYFYIGKCAAKFRIEWHIQNNLEKLIEHFFHFVTFRNFKLPPQAELSFECQNENLILMIYSLMSLKYEVFINFEAKRGAVRSLVDQNSILSDTDS